MGVARTGPPVAALRRSKPSPQRPTGEAQAVEPGRIVIAQARCGSTSDSQADSGNFETLELLDDGREACNALRPRIAVMPCQSSRKRMKSALVTGSISARSVRIV